MRKNLKTSMGRTEEIGIDDSVRIETPLGPLTIWTSDEDVIVTVNPEDCATNTSVSTRTLSDGAKEIVISAPYTRKL